LINHQPRGYEIAGLIEEHVASPQTATMRLGVRPQAEAESSKSAALLRGQTIVEDLGQKLDQAPGSTTTHSGFGDRLSESVLQFVLGIALIIFSIPVLWFNEKRAAEMETLLVQGASDCLPVGGQQADHGNNGCLVHITDEKAHAAAPVRDDCFEEASFDKGCLRLNRTAEIYQWVEQKTERSEDQLGGGRRTTTSYSYHTEWNQALHDSSKFHDQSKANLLPNWLTAGVKITNCDRVDYGDAFVLPEDLVSQCQRFVEAELPAKMTARGHVFRKSGEHYCCRPDSDGTSADKIAATPQVGDVRVRFTYVADGVVTVIALQDEAKDGRTSFLPFRSVSRGLFGISKEEETKRRLVAGRKTSDELSREATWTAGPLSCLCCACNIVAGCMQGVLTPEIYHLYEGSVGIPQCFERMDNANRCGKWLGRFVGWMMMYIGLCGVFAPFVAVLAVIPFLSHMGSWVVTVFSFFVTLVVASLISALAWLAYRPLIAAAYIAVAWIVSLAITTLAATGKKGV
jgi:hypothetical protein